MSDRLSSKKGRSYAVDRETRVADEKEPDVRLLSLCSDAKVPIEIKVAGSCSVSDLEAALRDQLCGQYLRARDGRHGILLIVYQKPRARGWQNPHNPRRFLTFEQVVQRLRTIAAEIARRGFEAPEPEVVILDVSSCTRADEPSRERAEAGRHHR